MSRKRWSSVFVVALLAACGSIPQDEVVCGDGQLEPGEQCDDGNAATGDGCSPVCAIEMTCGNGLVEGSEQCDDHNVANGDGCSASCATEMQCGNEVVEGTEECDDGGIEDRDGCSSSCTSEAQYAYTASWSFRTIANVIQACPAMYDTIAVYSQPVDASNADLGPPLVDLFDCVTMTGTITPVYEGRYRVWLESTDANNTMSYAKSTSAILDLSMSGLSFTANIYTDGGYFQWVWNLVGETSGNPLTCAAAGTDSVEIISTVTSGTDAYSDIFECLDASGISAALPAGGYTFSAAALNGAEQSLGTAPAFTNVIQAPNKVTDLGTITIPITGL